MQFEIIHRFKYVFATGFSQKSSLKTHEKIHEATNDTNSDKCITCELCDRKFIQKTNYLQHLRTCHRELFGESAENCHACPHCSCSFETAQGLSAHVSRHHPEKPSMKSRVALLSESNKKKVEQSKTTSFEASDNAVLVKNKLFHQVVLNKHNNFTGMLVPYIFKFKFITKELSKFP